MVLSQYNVYVQDHPRTGYTTIYNTLNKDVICIKTERINDLSDNLKEKMISKGFIVKDKDYENEKVCEGFNNNEFNSDELRIMLILTRKCNFNCIYCYENAQNASFDDMTNVESVQKFILETMKQKGLSKLKIIFYGGEPLLKKEIITIVAKYFSELLNENFRCSIITNGSLLDENNLSIWSKNGLESIKVTMDGNECCHNKRRPYSSGKGSYKDILKRLEMAQKYVRIYLNIVIDESVSGVEELIDELASCQVVPEFVLSVKEPFCGTPKEKKDLVLKYVRLLKNKKVYQSTKIAGEHGSICMGKDQNYYVIDGRQQVYQCNANFNSIIGSIATSLEEPTRKKLLPECKQCKYLPICYGDCVFKRKCEKEYFDIVIPELVKIYTEVAR